MILKKNQIYGIFCLWLTCMLMTNVSAQLSTKEYQFDEVISNEYGIYESATNNAYLFSPEYFSTRGDSLFIEDGYKYFGEMSYLDSPDYGYLGIEPDFYLNLENETYNYYDETTILAQDFNQGTRKSEYYEHFSNQTVNATIAEEKVLPANSTNQLEIFSLRAVSYDPRYRNTTQYTSTGVGLEGDISYCGCSIDSPGILNLTLTDIATTPMISFNYSKPSELYSQESCVIISFGYNLNQREITFEIGGISFTSTEISTFFKIPFNSVVDQVNISFTGGDWTLSDKISLTSCYILYPEEFIDEISINRFEYIQDSTTTIIDETDALKLQYDESKSFIRWDSKLGAEYNLYFKLNVSQIPSFNPSMSLTITTQDVNCSIEYFTSPSYPSSQLSYDVYGITWDFQGMKLLNMDIKMDISLIYQLDYFISTYKADVVLNFSSSKDQFSIIETLAQGANEKSLEIENAHFDNLHIYYEGETNADGGTELDSSVRLLYLGLKYFKAENHLVEMSSNLDVLSKGILSLEYDTPINFSISTTTNTIILNRNEKSNQIDCELKPNENIILKIPNINGTVVNVSNIIFTINIDEDADLFAGFSEPAVLIAGVIGIVVIIGGVIYKSKKNKIDDD